MFFKFAVSMRRALVILALLLVPAEAQPELLKNPNFEEAFNGQENWWCNGCKLEKSSDAHQGTQSGNVTERMANWAGVTQFVPVQPNKTYHFNAFVKVLNQQEGALFHMVDILVTIDYQDGGKYHQWLAKSPYMKQSSGWTQIGGDFKLGEKAISQARVYVQFADQPVNYLVDTASLKEVVDNPSWREEADARIETIRKRDFQIRLNADVSINPRFLELEVRQDRHLFGFGSAVVADYISGTDERAQRYQDTFYDMFQWATLENALKWRQMEWNRGQINYDRPERAIDALVANGIPVRGHCITWGVDQRLPNWLLPMDGYNVSLETTRRIEGVVGRFRGKLAHWDVNNEQIHGPFFENKTGDAWYTEQMFREANGVDANVKLYFNEYNVLKEGGSVYAYIDQVKHAKESGNTPVYGLGAQGHMPEFFDIATIQRRLDALATAGTPIWITELTVLSDDRNVRADNYENMMRLGFSHPSVEGITLWGFWDGAHYQPQSALVEGENFQLNAAGLRWNNLVKNIWRTQETLQPRDNQETFNLRGFHGNYTITVSYRGEVAQTQTFMLDKGTGALIVDVTVEAK